MFEVSGRVQDARDEARPTRFMVKPVAPCCSSCTWMRAEAGLGQTPGISIVPRVRDAEAANVAVLELDGWRWER